MRAKITIKKGPKVLAEVHGVKHEIEELPMKTAEKVVEVEQFLEQILGLRIHVEFES